MTVKIMNMRKSLRPGVAADFDAEVDEWQINRCLIIETENGKGTFVPGDFSRSYLALAPFVDQGIRSVKIPARHWLPFVNAAVDAYLEWRDGQVEDDDAGMRRFLSAEQETCEMAGL